jgi:hypothetical protein
MARYLALGMVAGSILFTLAWFVLGFLSPGFTIFGTVIEPYSPISQPLSGLGLGLTGPYMNTAFELSGLLILVGVIGVFRGMTGLDAAARRLCTVLLALSPLGMVIDGLFTLESFLLHMLGFLLGSGSLVVSFLFVGRKLRRVPGWERFGSWLILASPLTLVLFVLSFTTYDQAAAAAGLGIAGLAERILAVEVSSWFVALGWLGFRRPAPPRTTVPKTLR